MTKLLINYLSERIISKWLILFCDVVIICFAFGIACLIRHNFDYTAISIPVFFRQLALISVFYLLFFLLTTSYAGIMRHTAMSDVFRILKASSLSLTLLLIFNVILSSSNTLASFMVPYSILISHFLLASFSLIGFRVFAKLFYLQLTRKCMHGKIPIIIYGAGASGMLTKNVLVKDVINKYQVIAYIDDNHSKVNKILEGIPVLTKKDVLCSSYVKQHGVKQLIIAIQNLPSKKKKNIIDRALKLSLEVKVVPAAKMWINGQLSTQQLRRVKIEELLGRDVIKIDNINIYRELKNKVIMVTGGAGSIGSEIVQQICSYSPKSLIIVDQAESAIFDLQFQLKNSCEEGFNFDKIQFVIANIVDRTRMDYLFKTYRPEIIYHAAAYKHVPLMEENPYEAIMINVFGTKIIADLSLKYNVEKFVMISTDKAVNPTNIMGATKRIAEMYIQSIGRMSTKFVTTRFGNVLGSNGSVVPLFRKQIEMGGPVTITHKDITRYFMTIPEACNLVLEAGAMGRGSDIFIFDMGTPIRVYDLAKNMIRLSGVSEDEILIEEIGLRPGEKLYEELLVNEETSLPTHHPKIMRSKVCNRLNGAVSQSINELSVLIADANEYEMVAKMKQIVPEFISNNSVYEKLDVKAIEKLHA